VGVFPADDAGSREGGRHTSGSSAAGPTQSARVQG